jgi:hypothetical protein
VCGQSHAPAALHPEKRPSALYTEGWLGPRLGLEECGKSLSHRNSIPGPVASRYTEYAMPAHIICHIAR